MFFFWSMHLVACAERAADGYVVVADALALTEAVAGAGPAGAKLFTAMTFAAEEVPAVDAAGPKKDRRCFVKYTLPASGFRGESSWGYAPGSGHACDDAEAATAALRAAKVWARGASRAHYGEYDLLAAALEARGRDAADKQALAAQAEAWDVDFDLESCVVTRTARYTTERASLAAARCAAFEQPVRGSVETRDALTLAAQRARKRLADSAVRQLRTPPVPLPGDCQAVAAAVPLAAPGDTTVEAAGTPVAFALQVFAGETVTVYASATGFDPAVVVSNTGCNGLYAYNDDWRGRSSRASWRVSEDGDAIVIVRSSGGVPVGTANLTVEVEGANVLSTQQRSELETFASWAEGASDAEVAATWRGTASPEFGTACLDAALYGDARIAPALVAPDAADDCLAYLETVVAARKEAAAGQSLAGTLISGVKGALK